MSGPFDYFVVLAEMRTGSNFLETNLNAIDGVVCHGEAFNPHFIGYPKRTDILKVTCAQRDRDPSRLIEAIRSLPDGLGGFRFFHDHDPRALDLFMDDPRCAKIILTRNPLDSYLSWKIAQATGQWKLTDVKRHKAGRAVFDETEFAAHIQSLQTFQVQILNRLQISGQTAFYLAYEDLQSVDIINGIAKWLGVRNRLKRLDQSLKPQNAIPMDQRVANFDDMSASLERADPFNMTRTPNFEPRRGPAIPTYVAAAHTGLAYMPMRGGPEAAVALWLAKLDGVTVDDLLTGMTQKQLRQWKRMHPGHRSFTVLRHPVARAHSVFCARILNGGPGSFSRIRKILRQQFKLEISDDPEDAAYTLDAHRRAFETFLNFVKANIAGQTNVRTDAAWGTQSNALAGFGDFVLPDFVLREHELPRFLPQLVASGSHAPTFQALDEPAMRHSLSDIYDDSLEALVSDIYQRDYMMFGFGTWAADQAA
jgi:LPS sulfotransferase NodH